MRDYLYIWHDPGKQLVVASGVEFKDFLPYLSTCGGAILIRHESDVASRDAMSGFGFVAASELSKLAAEDIYSWGNFVWADCGYGAPPPMTDQEIAELLFFSHKAKPLQSIQKPSLSNRILCHVHDDGWRLRLYYQQWVDFEKFVLPAALATLGDMHAAEFKQGRHAFWCKDGMVSAVEKTLDVDSILNRHL